MEEIWHDRELDADQPIHTPKQCCRQSELTLYLGRRAVWRRSLRRLREHTRSCQTLNRSVLTTQSSKTLGTRLGTTPTPIMTTIQDIGDG